MLRNCLITLTAAAALTVALPAAAQTHTTPEEVVAFVQKAVAHIGTAGEAKAYADFSNTSGEWVKGELYVFCHRISDGTNLAHGGNPGLVGKNVSGFKDPDGVLVNQRIFDKVKADGKGWVEYKWPSPVTKKVEPKAIYSEKVGADAVCGSGYYK